MKFVHTFWIDEGKDPLEAAFGWCSAKYHLMSWALSSLQLHKFYDNVELITDTKGKELLIDQLKLPYKKVRIELDNLVLGGIPGLWVMKKIYSYTLHKEPFLNIDGDVFIFKPFPEDLLSGQLIAQNIEQDFDYYKELVGLVGKTFGYVPFPIKSQIKESLPIKASNAGILGGKDFRFFEDYYKLVRKFVTENKLEISELTPAQMVNFNAVVEQYIFHCLSSDMGIEVNYLLDTVYDPSFFESFANFHHLPFKIPFMHALGDYKKNGWVCDQLANRLRLDYPEYYYRIIELFESQGGDDKVHGAHEGFSNSQKLVSSFSIKYSGKSEDEKFSRTKGIISSICNQEEIPTDISKFSIFQAIEWLEKELTDGRSMAILNDVFDFEKEKIRLTQSLPNDDIIWDNEQEAIDRVNLSFATDQWKEKVMLKLSPLSMTIESEWDWSQNHVFFTRVKHNNIENNLTLEPYYYRTLLLPDKHHGEIIEYLLNPMETYLISLLSKEAHISITVVKEQVILFFENVNEEKVLVYLEEAIRFLAYSGVIFLKMD
ncbi:hypothetical protein P872_21685 [Rhodonellum psychrophilum GCM71 = DSM 17998]|uniref:DUF6734 domain-containing protein n=2 Tax=Rhodonellum TaxID=336827 RepID=U5BX29_9BACT|nr:MULTISPECIES: DUF6734 family protein [Rhodonellum]ERM80467.1 hypothetical protein P872_21685 [Rhodonellum psychrophilum GCM71 = DSM 17998]SDY95509.1 hypothetical protein SAMN05444412_10438 [Rhodonellum ikkaensis]